MRHEALVRLCKTGCQNKDGIPIGKTLKFVSKSAWFALNLHSKLSTCTCQTHAELYQINYSETAFYNRKVGNIYFDCSQTCFEEELSLRLKGGHCDRERDRSWIHVSFRFISVCTLFSNKRCQRQTGVFTEFSFCVRSFVARCCEMQCVCAQCRTI